MIILVAYATVEGHTADIAARIGEVAEAGGNQIVLANLSQPGFALPGRFDAVVLCGPIHIGHYPSQLVHFIQNWKDALKEVPSALVSVSLAIASELEEEHREAEGFPDKLIRQTGWKPDMRLDIAGALKYVEYDFFKRWVMKRIAGHKGGPVDTNRDHVLTDWNALDDFIRSFLTEAAKSQL
jgi:menaquinone-dependent protoporphyrinogen oxidase